MSPHCKEEVFVTALDSKNSARIYHPFRVNAYLDHVFYPTVWMSFYHWLNPNQRFHLQDFISFRHESIVNVCIIARVDILIIKYKWSKTTYMGVQTIWHQFKLSIRGNVGDCTVIFKSWQAHTLMKFDILQFYCLTLASWNTTKQDPKLQSFDFYS